MSKQEKTLRQIGDEAAADVTVIKTVQEMNARPGIIEEDRRMKAAGFVAMNGTVEQEKDVSGRHFQDNESAYYDLAAVEAHLDGKNLNIGHPLHAAPQPTQPDQLLKQ